MTAAPVTLPAAPKPAADRELDADSAYAALERGDHLPPSQDRVALTLWAVRFATDVASVELEGAA